jgi:CheY-like chemotaxis protein
MNQSSILVVDDNPSNLKLVAVVLACAGYNVVQAGSAQEAMALIDKSPPALVLVDIQMPVMDGLTFARCLKGSDKTSRIPIVALTALAMKGDQKKALAAGCDGYIAKPIETRKLPEQVASYLQNLAKEPRECARG